MSFCRKGSAIMDHNAEFLNYIYQNSQMGISAIELLTGKIENASFSNQLNTQLKEYKSIHQTAADKLRSLGNEEKDLPKLAELGATMSITAKTLTNHSPSHISEMMMQGSMMGIIDVTKNIKKYSNASQDVKDLADKLLKTEQQNIENLKQYL